ncbi:MAG: MFS transporter [Anaerolineae bacterium]
MQLFQVKALPLNKGCATIPTMTSTRGFYRPLIGALFLPNFLIALTLGIAEPVLPLYLQSTGASYVLVGTVVSALAIGRLLASLPASGVLTRFTMRRTMLFGLGIMTVALLLMGATSTIPLIFAGWLLAGAGLSLYELARHQFIAARIVNHNRGRTVAVIGGTFRLGNVIGPAVGGWVARQAGFQAPFYLMAGLSVITATAVLLFMPRQTIPYKPFSLRAYTDELRQTFQDCRHILLVAGSGQLMMQLVRRSRSIIIPLYAANALGLDVAAVGLVMSIGSVLDTLMFIPAGMIVDRYGRKAAIIPSLLIQAAGMFLLPLTVSFNTLTTVAALIGFGNGISSGTMITLGADLAPPRQRTPFLGLWRLSNSLGFALGPNIVGSVAAVLTLPLASSTIGIIALLAAGLFHQFVPETLQRQETASPSHP